MGQLSSIDGCAHRFTVPSDDFAQRSLPTKPRTELDDLAAEWDLTLGTVSDGSREVYLRAITQFGAWLAAEHPDATSVEHLRRRHVDGWMRHLADDLGRSEATRRVRLIALRKFLAYLASEPDIPLDANPAEHVALPSPKDKVVPIIHDADLVTLLRPIERGSTFVDRRDAAILRVLIDTGCRRGELASIDVDDVDLRTHDIRLRRTKGGDERLVPIGGKAALALRRCLRARQRHAAACSPALFLSIRSGDRGGWRISGGWVAEAVVRAAVEAESWAGHHPEEQPSPEQAADDAGPRLAVLRRSGRVLLACESLPDTDDPSAAELVQCLQNSIGLW